mgnify:FL=1
MISGTLRVPSNYCRPLETTGYDGKKITVAGDCNSPFCSTSTAYRKTNSEKVKEAEEKASGHFWFASSPWTDWGRA